MRVRLDVGEGACLGAVGGVENDCILLVNPLSQQAAPSHTFADEWSTQGRRHSDEQQHEAEKSADQKSSHVGSVRYRRLFEGWSWYCRAGIGFSSEDNKMPGSTMLSDWSWCKEADVLGESPQ